MVDCRALFQSVDVLFWLAHTLLGRCLTVVYHNGLFDLVDASVTTGSFVSALNLILSGFHNLLFLVKCARQQWSLCRPIYLF